MNKELFAKVAAMKNTGGMKGVEAMKEVVLALAVKADKPTAEQSKALNLGNSDSE